MSRRHIMKSVRNLAGGLLLLTGVLHLVSVALVKFEATSIITIIFGVAYLVNGYFLFRSGRIALWFGAIVPLVGLGLAVIGMLMKPTLLSGIFITIDIIISVCCFSLIFCKQKDLAL
jgi:hypothetical protein